MATSDKNQALFDPKQLPDASTMHFGIVVAEWNTEITEKLLDGCQRVLDAAHATIHLIRVPGTFELISGAKLIASRHKLDAVICLGCVIQGETRHFDFICQSVAIGLTTLNATTTIPFIFGVLTTENIQQAQERCGGKHGHKGEEAAITAIKMAALKKNYGSESKIGFM